MVTVSKELADAYVVFSEWLETADIPEAVTDALALVLEHAAAAERRKNELEAAVKALTGV